MKKYSLMFLLLALTLSMLSSCIFGAGRMSTFDNDSVKADERMNQIVDIIKIADKKALHDIFSKQALLDVDNFDENSNTFFTYIQGEIQSWESTGTKGGSYEQSDNGSTRKKIYNPHMYLRQVSRNTK